MGTTLKDMESYIYSTVILPLKELDVGGLGIASPIVDTRGNTVDLFTGREEVGHRSYDHNFQRDEARNSALELVWHRYRNHDGVLADYDRRRHNVVIYTPEFNNIKGGKLLMNKLLQAFNYHAPFNKVTLVPTTRDGYQGGYSDRYPDNDADDVDVEPEDYDD